MQDRLPQSRGDDVLHLPKSPMKVELVDYIDDGDGTGTLKMAGIALPRKDVYIYVDDQPLVRVVAADDGMHEVDSTRH